MWGGVHLDFLFPPDARCSLLERLTLCQCDQFENLPEDINDRLPCLRELSISKCKPFSERPEHVTSLSCLRSLKLSDCRFPGLPDSFGDMPQLKVLVLHKLDINFPDSCSRLQSLETLVVAECASLVDLPDPLGALTALKTLCLADTPLLTLPVDLGELSNLETLYLKQYRARHLLPSSFTALLSLTRLELQECELAQLPEAMGELTRLRELYIVSSPLIETLPQSVSALVKLETLGQLELTGCEKLENAPERLPRSLEILSLGSSDQFIRVPVDYMLPSLKRASMIRVILSYAFSSCLSSLEHLRMVVAFSEEEFLFALTDLPCLRTLALGSAGVMRLPGFSSSSLQELRRLELHLPELTEIPATIAALRKLTYLEIDAPRLRSLLDAIGALSRLRKLGLLNCPALTRLPDTLTQLSFLRVLQRCPTSRAALPCPSRHPAGCTLPCPARRAALPCLSRRPAGSAPPSPACRVALLTAASPCPARAPPCLPPRNSSFNYGISGPPSRAAPPCRSALPSRTAVHCPTASAPTATTAAFAATAATLATASTAAMASPTVLTFDAEGRAVDIDVWVDDLQLFLQCDSRDGVSLFYHTSSVSTAPTATTDSTVRSQWTTRDAVTRLAVRSHLPPAERAHFGQYKTAQSLYDAVVARYSSPATAALGRLKLPYLFPDLAAFATVADLVAHLRTSDARYRAALPTECFSRRPSHPFL
ncbi:unnamed protein product [Closterium sp. NIES-54]